MGSKGIERRLSAILNADVVGYSRLMAEDEATTIRTLTAYREQITTLVHEHRGRVVDSPGDNLLAELPSALDAVSCAVEVQKAISARNAELPPERRMEFRIGVHLGDVVVEGERIYGDGVNIAARLEGLARTGEICMSDMVYSQVRNKLDLRYEDLGEQEVKNIPEPIRVYRIQSQPDTAAPLEALVGMDDLTVPGFSGRPAMAVLPFQNLSRDPEQEYFADGIVEDLITRLSSWRDFPVIARNSSFIYKGKAVDVKQVSRELGVRYVVEGSVRRAGDRVRITAQLIDATTGLHVWAERYDRELQDIFALQDEITEAIVASMSPELYRAERERSVRQATHDLNAWDCAQRGFWHFTQFRKDDNRKARRRFEQAGDLDPRFAPAFYGLAWTHYADLYNNWTESRERSLVELTRTAQRSVVLDETDHYAHLALGIAHRVAGQRDQAIAAFERAIQLNPSSSGAYFSLGSYLAQVGSPDDAVKYLEKAIRLSPHDELMPNFLSVMGVAHFVAGRYTEALDWAQKSARIRSDFSYTHSILAASYAHLERIEEARTALAETLRLQPDFSGETVRLAYASGDPAFVERYIEGLRKAGLKA